MTFGTVFGFVHRLRNVINPSPLPFFPFRRTTWTTLRIKANLNQPAVVTNLLHRLAPNQIVNSVWALDHRRGNHPSKRVVKPRNNQMSRPPCKNQKKLVHPNRKPGKDSSPDNSVKSKDPAPNHLIRTINLWRAPPLVFHSSCVHR